MKIINFLHLYTLSLIAYGYPPRFSISTRKVSPLLMNALPSSYRLRYSVCLALGIVLATVAVATAANPTGDLRIEIIAAYNLVVDSNVESPSTYAPEAATLGAKICNDGANDLTDAFAYIGNFNTATPSSSTPGRYPSVTNPSTGQVGTFSLTHEGGSAGMNDATRYIGAIPAGECVTQYWLISYPRLDDNGDSVTRGIKSDDDLVLSYDIWASANDGATALTADDTRTVTMRNEISAAANKIWPNGDNKVPDAYKTAIAAVAGWDTVTPSGTSAAYPGELVRTQGIWYDFGVANQGFDNNGDLIPDQNAWAQPIGDPDSYDPGCFRLVRTYGLIVVKLKGGGEYLIAFEDQLYFENLPDNTGVVGLVYYEYVALNGACIAGLTPYQEVASGAENEKFNGDYGHYVPPLESQESDVTMAKSVTQSTIGPALPATLDYTIQITNSGSVVAGNYLYGVPLVIHEMIPTGTNYVVGTADDQVIINGGAITAKILYSTDDGTTWTLTEPASGVTDIQWWLQGDLPVGATGSVTFQVTVPSGYSSLYVLNTGGLSFGNAAPFIEDDAKSYLLGNNSIAGTVFEDDGAGANFADEQYDTGDPEEVGIQTVTVTLYIDTIDGLLLWATTTTNATGDYSFTQLPAGDYVIEVNTGLPASHYGWIESGDTTITVTGLSGGVTSGDHDFGFLPALKLTKSIASSPISEGHYVTYTLQVENNLATGAASNGNYQPYTTSSCTYSLLTIPSPTTVIVGDDAYTLASSPSIAGFDFKFYGESVSSMYISSNGMVAFASIADDGYPIASFPSSTYVKTIAGFWTDLNPSTGGTIRYGYVGSAPNRVLVIEYLNVPHFNSSTTKISGQIQLYEGTDEIRVQITSQGMSTQPATQGVNYDGATAITVTGRNAQNWTATNECTSFQRPADLDPDQILNPVPLIDSYDPAKLQYVSSSVIPSAVDETTGTITWDNVGPIGYDPVVIEVIFKALEPTGNSTETITNTATVDNAYFANGTSANDDEDSVAVTLNPTAKIGDHVWSDKDSDGVWDSGEPGIPGVTVNLQNSSGTVIASTITDARGYYLFEGLSNGSYTVVINTATLPTGYTGTHDPDATVQPKCATTGATSGRCNHQSAVTITSATNNLTQDFGYKITTALFYGTIWEDNNGDGNQDDGENALSGVTVYLCPSSSSTCTTPTQTTTTDSDGNYVFRNVAAGTYYVKVNTATLPSGGTWTQTDDPDATLDSKLTTAVTVAAGDVSGSHDFAYTHTGTASIGDTLYADWDGDGAQDTNEEGIPNIVVYLYEDGDGDGTYNSATDALIISATTTITGYYNFAALPTGDYLVMVDSATLPTYWTQTGDPDSTTDNMNAVDNLSSTLNTVDFGYQPLGLGSIGDTVWYDKDGDGVQGGIQEIGLADITVELWVDLNNDGVYVLVMTTTTDANGAYLFANLPDGDYEVVIDEADSDLPTDAFGNNYVATTDTLFAITLSNGNSNLSADSGFAALAAIGDVLFWDANGDAEFDWNESGIDGVEVTLTNATVITTTDGTVWPIGSYVLTTTTVNGYYLFDALPPGDYTITVDTTGPINGALQTGDADRDGVACTDNTYPTMPACDDAATVTVTYATNFMGADFGYQSPGAFGDYLWFDQDGDGVQDSGEVGIAGVVVTATTTANVTVNGVNYPTGTTLTTQTDYDGYYSFDNLVSNGSNATWTVTAQTPSNMAATYDPDATYNGSTTVTINTSGAVIAVGGSSCTACSLTVDFGFELDGPYILSGSICLESSSSENGVCGNGTDTVVTAYTVYLYNDAGDYLGATTTNASGQYTFSNLIDDTYYVAIGTTLPPLDEADLTTTASDTPATLITENAASVYQTVPLNGASQSGVDFAFLLTVPYDYGDLPQSYNTTLEGNPSGPRHLVAVGQTLYLGSTAPDSESNGSPTTSASGDGADEDGVTPVSISSWVDGNDGGSVTVTAAGSGWLVAWIDFNSDGDVLDTGEMIINQAVTAGSTTISFDIPSGTMTGANSFYSRFRLFSAAPLLPQFAYVGVSSDGEVEDYRWSTTTPTADLTIVKYDNLDPMSAGATLSYTIIITNTGPDDADNVVITDTLPVSTTYVSASAGCTPTATQVVCNLGTIAVNDTVTITIVVLVDPSVTQRFAPSLEKRLASAWPLPSAVARRNPLMLNSLGNHHGGKRNEST